MRWRFALLQGTQDGEGRNRRVSVTRRRPCVARTERGPASAARRSDERGADRGTRRARTGCADAFVTCCCCCGADGAASIWSSCSTLPVCISANAWPAVTTGAWCSAAMPGPWSHCRTTRPYFCSAGSRKLESSTMCAESITGWFCVLRDRLVCPQAGCWHAACMDAWPSWCTTTCERALTDDTELTT